MTPKHSRRKACLVGVALLACRRLAVGWVAVAAAPITEETAHGLVETAGFSATVGRATLLEFPPEDRLLVAGEYGALAWDLGSKEVLQRLDRSVGIGWMLDVTGDVQRLAACSPDGTQFACAVADSTVHLEIEETDECGGALPHGDEEAGRLVSSRTSRMYSLRSVVS